MKLRPYSTFCAFDASDPRPPRPEAEVVSLASRRLVNDASKIAYQTHRTGPRVAPCQIGTKPLS